MTYKLHMDGVLTGALNSFCLACDMFLKSEQEASEHIVTSGHKKNLTAVQYSDKFQNEHIRRFKGGYYCEFCNVLLPIASKVNLHVTEEGHQHNKGILLLKPMGGDVVAFNNILLDEQAWHGLIDGVCSLCNAEFDDENEHKTDTSHCLHLVLKPVQFAADNAIYRHLDDAAVQCLTCNKLLAPCRLIQHLNDSEHNELYAKRRIETNGVHHVTEIKVPPVEKNDTEKKSKMESDPNNNKKSPSEENSRPPEAIQVQKAETFNGRAKKPSAEEKSKILESIVKYQSKGINVNLETDTVYCKKCSEVLTFDFMAIEKHIENHSSAKPDSDLLYPSNLDQNLNRVNINDKTTPSHEHKKDDDENEVIRTAKLAGSSNEGQSGDPPNEEDNDSDDSSSSWYTIPPFEATERCSKDDEPLDFAKANQITYNGDNNQSYCRMCEVHLPASFKSMKEHVAGANHQKNVASLKQQENPGKRSKQETRKFVNSAYDFEGFFYNASIVNEKYCISQNSFYLISENNPRMRCIICEVNLPPYTSIEEHVQTRQHSLRFLGVPFIVSESNEFIREVRPGLFHCGYCHLVVSSWSDMKKHLECSDHQVNRRVGEDRFMRHLPALQRFKMRKQMEAFAMMRLFNML